MDTSNNAFYFGHTGTGPQSDGSSYSHNQKNLSRSSIETADYTEEAQIFPEGFFKRHASAGRQSPSIRSTSSPLPYPATFTNTWYSSPQDRCNWLLRHIGRDSEEIAKTILRGNPNLQTLEDFNGALLANLSISGIDDEVAQQILDAQDPVTRSIIAAAFKTYLHFKNVAAERSRANTNANKGSQGSEELDLTETPRTEVNALPPSSQEKNKRPPRINLTLEQWQKKNPLFETNLDDNVIPPYATVSRKTSRNPQPGANSNNKPPTTTLSSENREEPEDPTYATIGSRTSSSHIEIHQYGPSPKKLEENTKLEPTPATLNNNIIEPDNTDTEPLYGLDADLVDLYKSSANIEYIKHLLRELAPDEYSYLELRIKGLQKKLQKEKDALKKSLKISTSKTIRNNWNRFKSIFTRKKNNPSFQEKFTDGSIQSTLKKDIIKAWEQQKQYRLHLEILSNIDSLLTERITTSAKRNSSQFSELYLELQDKIQKALPHTFNHLKKYERLVLTLETKYRLNEEFKNIGKAGRRAPQAVQKIINRDSELLHGAYEKVLENQVDDALEKDIRKNPNKSLINQSINNLSNLRQQIKTAIDIYYKETPRIPSIAKLYTEAEQTLFQQVLGELKNSVDRLFSNERDRCLLNAEQIPSPPPSHPSHLKRHVHFKPETVPSTKQYDNQGDESIPPAGTHSKINANAALERKNAKQKINNYLNEFETSVIQNSPWLKELFFAPDGNGEFPENCETEIVNRLNRVYDEVTQRIENGDDATLPNFIIELFETIKDIINRYEESLQSDNPFDEQRILSEIRICLAQASPAFFSQDIRYSNNSNNDKIPFPTTTHPTTTTYKRDSKNPVPVTRRDRNNEEEGAIDFIKERLKDDFNSALNSALPKNSQDNFPERWDVLSHKAINYIQVAQEKLLSKQNTSHFIVGIQTILINAIEKIKNLIDTKRNTPLINSDTFNTEASQKINDILLDLDNRLKGLAEAYELLPVSPYTQESPSPVSQSNKRPVTPVETERFANKPIPTETISDETREQLKINFLHRLGGLRGQFETILPSEKIQFQKTSQSFSLHINMEWYTKASKFINSILEKDDLNQRDITVITDLLKDLEQKIQDIKTHIIPRYTESCRKIPNMQIQEENAAILAETKSTNAIIEGLLNSAIETANLHYHQNSAIASRVPPSAAKSTTKPPAAPAPTTTKPSAMKPPAAASTTTKPSVVASTTTKPSVAASTTTKPSVAASTTTKPPAASTKQYPAPLPPAATVSTAPLPVVELKEEEPRKIIRLLPASDGKFNYYMGDDDTVKRLTEQREQRKRNQDLLKTVVGEYYDFIVNSNLFKASIPYDEKTNVSFQELDVTKNPELKKDIDQARDSFEIKVHRKMSTFEIDKEFSLEGLKEAELYLAELRNKLIELKNEFKKHDNSLQFSDNLKKSARLALTAADSYAFRF